MKKLLLSLIGAVLCSSCVVSTTAPAPRPIVVVTPTNTIPMWNTQLGITAYPNSQLLEMDSDKNGSSKVVFTSSANLSTIYAHIHNQLNYKGWQRTELDYKDKATKLEAKYRLSNRELRIKLDAEGKSNRYKLELKF